MKNMIRRIVTLFIAGIFFVSLASVVMASEEDTATKDGILIAEEESQDTEKDQDRESEETTMEQEQSDEDGDAKDTDLSEEKDVDAGDSEGRKTKE